MSKPYMLFVFLLSAAICKGEVVLPKILGNGMVLQRNKPVVIWGNAAKGEAVTVKFGRQLKRTMPDTSGTWKVVLDAMPASAVGQPLVISGTNTIVLNDVLVGEVWLCSGQSNMSYEMRKLAKTKPDSLGNWPLNEVENAHNPQIRIFLVTNKNLRKPDPSHSGWSIAQDSALRAFSMAGYFFAKRLNSELNVPVGIISAAIPGSRIEPWVSREALESEPYFKNNSIKIDGDPGKFFENMIKPLAPLSLRGFLWYQGESGAFLQENVTYAYKMDALINNWRTLWADTKLPFYYVQIAPYEYSKAKDPKHTYDVYTEAELREGQTQALKIPNTGMVITTDLNANLGDLHPVNKWEIGYRLAQMALANTYGFKKMVPSGPLYDGMKVVDNQIIINFKYVDGGLISKDGKPLSDFEIAGADGVFVAANATIKGGKIYLSAPGISKPTAARFAWHEAAMPNFYNKAGLPAAPFHTNTPYQFKPISR